MYYRGGRRFNGWVCGGAGIAVSVIVLLTVTLSIRFSSQGEDEKHYAPGDTRIHSFSSFFCSSLQVSVPELPSSALASVYLLRNDPSLTDTNVVNFTSSFSLSENDYEYWHFYLYPGSNISYSGCVSSSSTGSAYTFYIIKGTGNFNNWKNDPSTSRSVSHSYVTSKCDSSSNTVSYSIRDEDHYYLAYSYVGDYSVSGRQSLNIERFEYSAPNNSLYSCQLSGSDTCKLSVSFSSSTNKALVIMPIPSNVDWDSTTYNVIFKCSPQAAGYAIITLAPFGLLALIIAAAIGLACYFRMKKKQSYKPLGPQQENETEKTPVYTEQQPPPYNPSY